MFFTFILPPIIFAAGYNLRRRSFFKYFLYIFLYGVLGTIVTFSVVAPLTYWINSKNWFAITFSNHELPVIDDNIITANVTHALNETVANMTEFVNNSDIGQVVYNRAISFSLKEILLFSAVISATDTVAALTFIKEEQEPKLFAILFGEGVINDAVCIVLYGILRQFTSSDEGMLNL
jgi:sodium/hydrogen exchanger-like protein 6/7